jgi:hypothetical protein
LGNDQRWFSVGPAGRNAVLDTSPLRFVLWRALTMQCIVEEVFAGQPESLLRIHCADFCEVPGQALA